MRCLCKNLNKSRFCLQKCGNKIFTNPGQLKVDGLLFKRMRQDQLNSTFKSIIGSISIELFPLFLEILI